MIRPYHIKEEDKTFIDKEMKRLCYLGILKEGFSAYSSPVMFINRKFMNGKRVVTDFRHLNVRIANNNLAYLQSSINVRFERCFSFFESFRKLKKKLWNINNFDSTSYLYQRMPMGLNISQSIWHSYINAV